MLRRLSIIAALSAMGLFAAHGSARADSCGGGACGTPEEQGGGGNCGGGAGSVLVAMTDFGVTTSRADDADQDGWEDDVDVCPAASDPGQEDSDGDGVGDACDLCRNVSDADQKNTDGDTLGDACDSDDDNDGVPDLQDNCAAIANPAREGKQADADSDGVGNACDTDDDDDGILDIDDNCPLAKNPDQKNTDPDLFGDACDEDFDQDNISDSRDNCLEAHNPEQADLDSDGVGDACDVDDDGDNVLDVSDNCATKANPDQANFNGDAMGDACDPTPQTLRFQSGDTFCEVDLAAQGPATACAPDLTARTGEAVRLPIVYGRENVAIGWQFSWEQRPAGAQADLVNPVGQARISTKGEYHPLLTSIPQFVAQDPGVYQVKLTVDQVFSDPVDPAFPRTASHTFTVTVEGDSKGGCAVGGNASAGLSTGLLLLAGVLLLRRRRG